jgi:hypothetical protein
MNTPQAVATMMKWNTGSHFLDSGGYGDRQWQKLANVDLDALPEATLDEYGYSRSMYHHLTSCGITYNNELSAQFDAYVAENDADTSWEDLLLGFCKFIKAEVDDGYNTVNNESVLDGNFAVWKLETDDDEYLVIRTHNGADYRGGWSKPFFFWGNDYDELIMDSQNGVVFCTSCDNRWYAMYGGKWESDETKHDWTDSWDGTCYRCSCGEPLKASY